jgi:transposase InsO family protein
VAVSEPLSWFAELREDLYDRGIKPVIPNRCNRKQPFSFSKRIYKLRWRIASDRLKDFRRIATRYDRLARNFGCPHPRRSLTGEGDLLATEARLVADHGAGTALALQAMANGSKDRPTSFCSPWQNGYIERLIGSIQRECTDHLLVFNAGHLRRTLSKYASYYNEVRTHVSLGRTRRADAQSSDSETLSRIRSLVGYIIATRESDFSEATTTADDINGR